MNFGFVQPPYGALWPKIEAMLLPAVESGGNDWDEVKQTLLDGRSQLWVTTEKGEPINATVTRMDGDTIEIWLCGGEVLRGSLHYLETITKAAKHDGATKARIIGRKGWRRALERFGWYPVEDELVKDLA